jgi:hypothetical protein
MKYEKNKNVDIKSSTFKFKSGQFRDTGNIGHTRHGTKTHQTNKIQHRKLQIRVITKLPNSNNLTRITQQKDTNQNI